MAENQPRRSGNRRRRRKRRPRNYLGNETPPLCPLCEQSIRDILTAIMIDDGPAHFDCVLKKLTDEEELRVKEKICYLGGGSFGVVKFQNDPSMFSIRKRIQIEPKDTPIDWRKRIAENVTK